MSDIHITINGGTNTIVPNATKVEQHFHGIHPEEKMQPEQDADEPPISGVTAYPEADRLSLYINKVELPAYLAKLKNCRTAAELADIAVMILGMNSGLTEEEIVKARFINMLLPFAPMFEKGRSIDNVRHHINSALAHRPKTRH